MHSKPNKQLFPKEAAIQLSQLKTAVTSIFTFFSKLNYKTEQIGSKVDSSNSGGLIVEDHIHTDVTTCYIDEHNKSTTLRK